MTIKAITLRQAIGGQWSDADFLIDKMHRDRAETFGRRLKWDVNIDECGWEIDRFDTQSVNPLYLISVAPDGDYQGSLRLLPTTGPNMLRDVFPQLLGSLEPVESATIWESSRITAQSSEAFAELVIGLGETALKAGLTGIVTVVDKRIKRLVERLGCSFDVIGAPQAIGSITCYALMFTDPAQLATVRERSGLKASVLS